MFWDSAFSIFNLHHYLTYFSCEKKIWQPLYEIVFRKTELAEEDMQFFSFSIQLHKNKIGLILRTCWKRK